MAAAEDYVPTSILITGGAGFIASHVCEHLTTKYPQYQITCLDVLDRCASLNNLTEVLKRPNFDFVHGDIQNLDLVSYICKTKKIDTIMHFAAQSHVDNSFGNSMEFTKTNVLGTHVLLESARRFHIKRFVHVSTDEVYGDVLGDAAGEHTLLEPTNPYSCSKAAAEFITKAYVRSYNVPVLITRGNNVYGPNQYPEKVIPKFILRLLRGQTCCLHGDGGTVRNYVHVKDVARAFDVVLHKGKVDEIYNIGTEFEISINDLAKRIIELIGLTPTEKYMEYVADRNINDKRYAIDVGKLAKLGWTPEIDFERGIRDTIEWYRNLAPDHWDDVESSLRPHPVIAAGKDKPTETE
mmetsp:Transcript_28623/g.61840  ORF Transcript_28623/g.61840 Transcript_28623/m.61840 type:complete len:352 (+) Transcript_28623:3-1058(+)